MAACRGALGALLLLSTFITYYVTINLSYKEVKDPQTTRMSEQNKQTQQSTLEPEGTHNKGERVEQGGG